MFPWGPGCLEWTTIAKQSTGLPWCQHQLLLTLHSHTEEATHWSTNLDPEGTVPANSLHKTFCHYKTWRTLGHPNPFPSTPVGKHGHWWSNRISVIGGNTILHLHNELNHDWYKHEGPALIGAETLSCFPFWVYKQAGCSNHFVNSWEVPSLLPTPPKL
jgi:hypothetical protein